MVGGIHGRGSGSERGGKETDGSAAAGERSHTWHEGNVAMVRMVKSRDGGGDLQDDVSLLWLSKFLPSEEYLVRSTTYLSSSVSKLR